MKVRHPPSKMSALLLLTIHSFPLLNSYNEFFKIWYAIYIYSENEKKKDTVIVEVKRDQ